MSRLDFAGRSSAANESKLPGVKHLEGIGQLSDWISWVSVRRKQIHLEQVDDQKGKLKRRSKMKMEIKQTLEREKENVNRVYIDL